MTETCWQYAIVNIGSFKTGDRLLTVLGVLGAERWELVHVYDKASNWFAGFEKGFVLFKRPVPAGEKPDGGWALTFDANGRRVVPGEITDW